MRLTLRTLLAYLDEILDPHDAEQLRRKIEDSEFATSLVHQIRGSVRRLRLEAPALDAQGIGADLNSVAEYLDNTLPPDQVPALEKICLDNEVHLGEVASSHQILTLVLGQAADISDALRRKVYDIAPTVEHPKFSPPVGGPPAPHIRLRAQPAPSPPAAPLGSTPDPATDVGADRQEVIGSPTAASPAISAVPPIPDTPATPSPTAMPSPTATSANTSDTSMSTPRQRSPRPSERFAKPVDIPSTKEAWRAEARQRATPETEVAAEPVAATADPEHIPPTSKKSSWLRTLTISALIVILIVAGLLAAVGPVNQNIVRWLGLDTQPVAAVDDNEGFSTPPAPLPESPPDTLQIERTETSPPTMSAEDTGFPAATAESDEMLPAAELPVANERPSIVPPMEETAGVQGGLELFPPGGPNGRDLIEDNFSAPGVVEEGSESGRELPVLEPVPRPLPTTGRQTAEVLPGEQPRLDREVADHVQVDPEFPPKTTPSLDGPIGGELASALAEPNIPRALDDATVTANRPTAEEPIVTPDLKLDPIPVNPPVASPTPAAAGDTALLPAEPSAPEPPERRVLEPTRLRSGDQLLLVFDSTAQDWKRLDATLPLSADATLLSLPAFRADLEIGAHITCTMVGATRLQLGPAPFVTLDSGQLILQTKTANRSLGIQHRGEVFDIWTSEPDGVVAVEASRQLIPGSDPWKDLPHTILRIHAMTNDASVRFKGQTLEIPQGQHLLRLDNFDPRLEGDSRRPKWTSAISISRADSSSVSDWKRSLNDAQDMGLWLQQRASNRRYNQRALASRCLAELDQFDAIVAALNDDEQHPFWDQQFEALQRAVARGPEVVNRMLLEFEKVHGPAGAELLEMVRGYNERQLAQGAAATLVTNLRNESLDRRVLAIQNLKHITGFTQSYRPEAPLGSRREPVKRWEGKLKLGLVTYARPPELVTLLNSFTQPAAAPSE